MTKAHRPAEVFDRLVRVQILLWNAADTRLRAAHELPLTWFEGMRIISQSSQARIRDIAAALLITEGGASKLVDRIQVAGFARRQPDPADGRSSQIVLTPAGVQILAAAQATLDAELADRISAALTDDDLARFDSALETLRLSNLKAQVPK
jgi:DNA-binding MarR family transcriptional regulator